MFYFGSNTKRDLSVTSHHAVVTTALRLATEFKDAQLFLLPTMPLFTSLKARATGSRLWIGNQTVSETSGRDITGEVSAQLLKSLQSNLVMIGHAERRQLFDDDNSVVAQLEQAALSRLRILYCVGESQVKKDLKESAEFLKIEPMIRAKLTEQRVKDISKDWFSREYQNYYIKLFD
ncbi:MAG: triose-phosphate isomerase [Holophagaceae bacterium]